MKKALQEAEMAFDKGEIPLGLLLSSMIVSRSHNLTELLNDVTAHAEKCKRSPLRQIIWEIFSRLHALRWNLPPDVCWCLVLGQIKLFWSKR
jgi:hypothetical protein